VTGRFFQTRHLHFWYQCFCRHDIYIDDISVFQTWHLQLYHQCFFRHDISVFQTWHLHLGDFQKNEVFSFSENNLNIKWYERKVNILKQSTMVTVIFMQSVMEIALLVKKLSSKNWSNLSGVWRFSVTNFKFR
jgi:hypothetical protein